MFDTLGGVFHAHATDRTFDGGAGRLTPRANHPRPAFGLRPWFAFLRRARSLRRFALAIAARRLPVTAQDAMWRLRSEAGDWEVMVHVVTSLTGRWRGLRPTGSVHGLILRTSSVHTFGMRDGLTAVALDKAGEVMRTARLRPQRVFTVPGARWIIELPAATAKPPVGIRLFLERRILG